MRLIIALAFLLMSFGALAQDNKAGSINYVPKAGAKYYEFNFDYGMGEVSNKYKDPSDVYTEKYETTAMNSTHQFWYGVTEKFTPGLELSYLLGKETKMKSTTQSGAAVVQKTEEKGLGDIVLYGRYGVTDTVDAVLGFSISPDDREEATSNATEKSKDGNNYSGGHAVDLEFSYVLDNGNFDVEFVGGLNYKLERTVISLSVPSEAGTLTKTEFDAKPDFRLGAHSEYDMGNVLLLAQLDVVRYGEDNGTTKVAGATSAKTVEEAYLAYGLTLGGRYLINNDIFVGGRLGYNINADHLVTVKDANGATTGKYDVADNTETVVGVDFGINF